MLFLCFYLPWLVFLCYFGYRLDMLRRCAAASAVDIDELFAEDFLGYSGESLWRFVVATHYVRQTCVRMH